MREYDIFIPVYYNDGSRVEAFKISRLHRRLLRKFGGFTFFPQPAKGIWTMGDVVFHDEILIIRVVAERNPAVRKYFRRLKETLKLELDQEEILIIERKVGLM